VAGWHSERRWTEPPPHASWMKICDFCRRARVCKYDALQTETTCWSNDRPLSRTTPKLLTTTEGLIVVSETAKYARLSARCCPRPEVNCMTAVFCGLIDNQSCESHLCLAITQLSMSHTWLRVRVSKQMTAMQSISPSLYSAYRQIRVWERLSKLVAQCLRCCTRPEVNCMTAVFCGLIDNQSCESHLCLAITQLSMSHTWLRVEVHSGDQC
jgi:hypothetical protein